jgi:predicted O-methyltransferase YrrM
MPDVGVFDGIVNDPRFAPFYGWHDDHAGAERAATYAPAVQQVRAEFLGLVEAIREHGPNRRALQIGLGHVGGAHLLFQQIFEEVWTIEVDHHLVDEYRRRFPGAEHFIVGNTRDPAVRDKAWRQPPFDFLFIDGGHTYDDVLCDYYDYEPMVRHGGIIAFHDAIHHGPTEGSVEVYKFLKELSDTGKQINMLGTDVGTAWLVK